MIESSQRDDRVGKPGASLTSEQGHSEVLPNVEADVTALRVVLDLMENFADNDQRARYLLSSNWLRERLARRQDDSELIDALHLRLRGVR